MSKVSVVMPVYKAAKTLRRSIESILNQTFMDFEFIIVNEFGSDDGSQEMIEEYAQRDNRVRLIQNTYRQGFAESLNIGILESKGTYIARMDADDYSYPMRFEKQVSYMEGHPKCVLCGTYFRMVKSDQSSYVIKNPCDSEEIKAKLLFDCSFGHPTVMFRRGDFIKNNWMYRSEYRGEDFELWTRVDGDVSNIPEILVDYYWHGENFSLLYEEEAIYGACQVVKAQLRRKLNIDRDRLPDLVYAPIVYCHKVPLGSHKMMAQVAELLADVEEKSAIHTVYSPVALKKVLCSRWNLCLRYFFPRFECKSLNLPTLPEKGSGGFRQILADALQADEKTVVGEISKRVSSVESFVSDKKTFIVFGAGNQAEDFFEKYPDRIEWVHCFVDNDSSKWGALFCDRNICPPQEILSIQPDFVVISSQHYFDEICADLIQNYNIAIDCIGDLKVLNMK